MDAPRFQPGTWMHCFEHSTLQGNLAESMSSDTLFTVRNSFYIGAYQAAIAEAADLDTLSSWEKFERDVFVYRSYIELGSYELVISEVSPSSPQPLQAVKLLAQYFGAKEEKDKILAKIQEWMEDPSLQTDDHTLLAAAIIHAKEGNDVEALKACHAGQSLELAAISIQLLLKIHRVDQAQERLKLMVSTDEDSTLTQLATAWIGVDLGGVKAEEASFIFQELGDRYNWTVRLLNGKAVCLLRTDRWSEALEILQEAFEKDVKNPETLANLVSASLLAGKPASRHINQLRTVAPRHKAIQNLETAEELFSTSASAY